MGMRAIQRLCKHGNGTSVTIPRVMLTKVGWLPGEYILVQELEDGAFMLRRPRADDVGAQFTPHVMAPRLEPVTP